MAVDSRARYLKRLDLGFTDETHLASWHSGE